MSDLKKTTYILTKKYVLLFGVIFIGAILFFFEHFAEAPITVAYVKTERKFEQKKYQTAKLNELGKKLLGLQNW